jgi:hypothetical protein
VANGFIAAHEDYRHIRKRTLGLIPLPRLGPADISIIDGLVGKYLALVRRRPDKEFALESSSSLGERARSVLLQIDALVLKGYALPPRLERQLLEFFRGEQRHVPFEFVEYHREGFRPNIPLWMYVAPDFSLCTAKGFLANAPRVTDPELIEAFHEVE